MLHYWFLFDEDRILLTTGGALPLSEEPPVGLHPGDTPGRLPDLEGWPCRYATLSEAAAPEGYEFIGLRQAFSVLPFPHYNMAGKARELIHFNRTTQYCSVCGSPMRPATDISRRCTGCGRQVWPSLSVAMIVAITRGDELLMVQSKNFKRNYMGLVAGFVETAETLEDCVRREVWEETHIKIRNIRYFGSQPWPYPSGLMVGFTAEYESGELQLQDSELRKGGWFTADHMPMVPGKLSMARMLIDHWLTEQGKGDISATLEDF